jgi:glycosyltransferase involved in cell wall biosynthesis
MFSVIIATYQRDDLIIPTLESVRRQIYSNFEVLVVSDGPYTTSLEKAVQKFDDRFKIYATQERIGSQSGPNNFGLKISKGEYIAYLGHDDIWHQEHLLNLFTTYSKNQKASFCVAGCVLVGPEGAEEELTWITGMFKKRDRKAPTKNFFPPSSISHKRELYKEKIWWPDPNDVRGPVDSEFLLRAISLNNYFVSTNKITVFKFNSAFRYLSYLNPKVDEQNQILSMLKDSNKTKKFVKEQVKFCKKFKNYMNLPHPNSDHFKRGEIVKIYEKTRGIDLPALKRIEKLEILDMGIERLGSDWYEIEAIELYKEGNSKKLSWRWSGPSPKPQILIPFCSKDEVKIALNISRFASNEVLESLKILVNGLHVKFSIKHQDELTKIEIICNLLIGKPTVLQLLMNRTIRVQEFDPNSPDKRKLGLCLSSVEIEPVRLNLGHNTSNYGTEG